MNQCRQDGRNVCPDSVFTIKDSVPDSVPVTTHWVRLQVLREC